MCKFAAFKQERHLHKVAHENINEIISAEVSQGSNALQQMCASPCLNSTHPRTFLFMFKQGNQVCLYNGSPVTFKLGDGTTTVNATQMAKPFGKLVSGWLRLESTKEFLNALSADMQIHTSALIQTVKGGNGEQGTWMHEDAALEFARWLSPKFAIWCNARIKELLTGQYQQPQKAEILPPPIDNQRVALGLVELVDGKAVTTSRKLAELLGRKHDSVRDTINSNLHVRAFKYGNFIKRPYTVGPVHGYEFLITRSGLEALASIMRYNAKDKIAEAYAGAWGAPVQKLLPLPAPQTEADESEEEVIYTPEQQKYIDFLESYNEDLGKQLRKAKEALKTYTDMYETEKRRRRYSLEMSGCWHDLYEDLMWRVGNDTGDTIDERLAAHEIFRKKILGRLGR